MSDEIEHRPKIDLSDKIDMLWSKVPPPSLLAPMQRYACPGRSDGGEHLPRFPVSMLNRMAGHEVECAYCGRGL